MPQTLSNLQLELLKSFSRNVSDEDVLAIKRLITTHFAQKATEGADQFWDAKGWNDEKVESLLNQHLKTPLY